MRSSLRCRGIQSGSLLVVVLATVGLGGLQAQKHLRPAVHPGGKRVERLLDDLDSRDFKTRSRAEAELEGHGELLLRELEAALKQKNTLEKRRRLEGLLQQGRKASLPFGTPERVAQW